MAKLTDFDRAIQQLNKQIDALDAAKQALLAAREAKPARAPRKRKLEVAEVAR